MCTDWQCFSYITWVPKGSPSRGGDVAVYVFDIKTNRAWPLPFSFILFLCLFLSLWPFQLYFIPKILPTTLRFLTLFFQLISALLILSGIYIFMKVSLSLDIFLCGWLGFKYQLSAWFQGLETTVRTNTIGPLMMAKYFAPLLQKGQGVLGVQSSDYKSFHASILVNMSAKVGSITDNGNISTVESDVVVFFVLFLFCNLGSRFPQRLHNHPQGY